MIAIIHSEKGAYAKLNGTIAKTRNDHGIWQFYDESCNVWVDTKIERLSFQVPGIGVFYKIISKALEEKNRYIELCGSGVKEADAMADCKAVFLNSIEWPN
jgi:hypothetical protein